MGSVEAYWKSTSWSDLVRERRIRRYAVPENVVFAWLALAAEGVKVSHLAIPSFPDLPHDVHVVQVRHEWQDAAFWFTVAHQSFDVAQDGALIPSGGLLRFDVVRLRREGDQPALDDLVGDDIPTFVVPATRVASPASVGD